MGGTAIMYWSRRCTKECQGQVVGCRRHRPFNPVASIQFLLHKNHSATSKNRCLSASRYDKHQLKTKNSKFITKSAAGMGAVMRRRRRACFSARRRRPAEAPRTGGRGRTARAPAQKQQADKPHLSGQPDGAA